MTIRRMFPLLAVAVVAVASWPERAAAQIGDCMHCDWSPFGPWPSQICVGDYVGWENCSQQGNNDYHWCRPYGDPCEILLDDAGEQLAISMVMAEEMLPADGDYFFVLDGQERVVMRKCDGTLVARVPLDTKRHAIGSKDREEITPAEAIGGVGALFGA